MHRERQTLDQRPGPLPDIRTDQAGITFIMVTHDPAAARYARRTLHLDKGHFVEKDLAA